MLGIVTDGDVRKALRRGASLDAPVGHHMNTAPITGRAGLGRGAATELMRAREIRHLPLVDAAVRLADRVFLDAVLARDPDADRGCRVPESGYTSMTVVPRAISQVSTVRQASGSRSCHPFRAARGTSTYRSSLLDTTSTTRAKSVGDDRSSASNSWVVMKRSEGYRIQFDLSTNAAREAESPSLSRSSG
jgi:hypothetical protein